MKLQKIKIQNYKSIRQIDFEVVKCGDSYTTVLLGKNETGKSNILRAMALLTCPKDEVDFLKIRNQDAKTNIVSSSFEMECDQDNEIAEYKKSISKKSKLPEDIVSRIRVKKAVKEVCIEENEVRFSEKWHFELDTIPLNAYVYKGNEEVALKIGVADLNSYQELTIEILKRMIEVPLEDFFSTHEPKVSFWSASKNHLINGKISLKNFAQTPNTYPALRNMFYLCGFDTNQTIETQIENADKNDSLRIRLQKTLQKKTTEYINKIWQKHPVKIAVEILSDNEMNATVTVQDEGNDYGVYAMSDRSQGFQQFISLILSLSIANHTQKIKNQLILIDEPETHLHPSGIRWMMKELLKIGANNYLFIATHSNFIIDQKHPERHILLKKNSVNGTYKKHIENNQNMFDDEILKDAFGINVIRDFLSPQKILVEGGSDKVLINKALKCISGESNITISNGKGDNLTAAASMLALNDIYPLVITDDDKKGKKIKDDIIKIDGKFSTENVFTIRDLNGDLNEGSTIEDTLPKEYVLSKINQCLKHNSVIEINAKILDDSKPFMGQVKAFLNKHISEGDGKKQKKEKVSSVLENIKIRVSEDYNANAIAEKAPLLKTLAEKILEHVRRLENF